MYYKFEFTQKPFKSSLFGQVETDNFIKWFCENAPFGVRLVGKAEELLYKEGGVTDYTGGFSERDIYAKIDTNQEIEEEV